MLGQDQQRATGRNIVARTAGGVVGREDASVRAIVRIGAPDRPGITRIDKVRVVRAILKQNR